jgi:hypothetical protein
MKLSQRKFIQTPNGSGTSHSFDPLQAVQQRLGAAFGLARRSGLDCLRLLLRDGTSPDVMPTGFLVSSLLK